MTIARLDTAASVAATTQTFSVSAGSDRMLVAGFGHEVSGQITVTGVDYGGQAMVQAVEQDTPDTGFSYGNSIWYLLEAGIAAASGSVITPTYSATPDDQMIHAISYENVEQAGGSSTNPATNGAESNEGTPNPLISDITETDEGCVVAIRGTGNATTHTWQSDLTEQTDQLDASSGSSLADRLSTTSGNVNVEGTAASQNRGAQAVATFAPSTGVTYEQEGFRWRNDDGSESAATWRQAQDVDDTIAKETNIRLRVLSDATGNPDTDTATIQYKLDTDPTAEFRDV